MTDTLPQGWEETTFSELFDFKGGSQPPKSTFLDEPRDGYVRLLQIRDFGSDNNAVYIPDEPKWPKCSDEDIMIGRYGASVGKILGGKAGAYNVALVKMLFDDKNINRNWVRNFLKSEGFQDPLRKLSRSAQNGFNKKDLADVKVELPPLNEQHRIVEKIDALMARSGVAKEALDAIPSLLDQYRQSVLAAAFRGDLTKDWREKNPDTEPAETLLDRIRIERRQRWEETELAKLRAKGKEPKNDKWKAKYKEAIASEKSEHSFPESWKVATLDQISWHSGYGTSSKCDYELDGPAVLRIPNIVAGKLNLGDVKFALDDSKLATLAPIDTGDLLVVRTNGSQSLIGR